MAFKVWQPTGAPPGWALATKPTPQPTQAVQLAPMAQTWPMVLSPLCTTTYNSTSVGDWGLKLRGWPWVESKLIFCVMLGWWSHISLTPDKSSQIQASRSYCKRCNIHGSIWCEKIWIWFQILMHPSDIHQWTINGKIGKFAWCVKNIICIM